MLDHHKKARITRAGEPMYVLSAHKAGISWFFMVLGSTGTQYKVCLSPRCGVSCTCPDFANHERPCKHIYMILMKVMKKTGTFINQWTEKWSHGLSDELNNIMYRRKSSKRKREAGGDKDVKKKRPNPNEEQMLEEETVEEETLDGERCLICFEPLVNGATWECNECHKIVGHESCLNRWFIKTMAKGRWNKPTCPHCCTDINKNVPDIAIHESKFDPFVKFNYFTSF